MYAYDRDYDSTTGSLAKPANSSLYGSGTYGYNPDTRTMMRQGYEGDQFYPEGVSSMYKRSRQSPQNWQGTRMETPDYQLERSLREGLFDQPQYNRELRRPLEKQTQEDTPISDFFVSKAAASDVIDLLDNLPIPNPTMRVKSAGVGIPLSPDQLQEYKYGDFADGPPETMMMSSRAQVVEQPSLSEQFANRMGFNPQEWKAYREAVHNVESRGSGNYKAVGKKDPQYLGRYQMGKQARKEATRIIQMVDKSFKEPTPQQFLNNPQLQEDMFAAYTRANFLALGNKSPTWAKMSDKDKKLNLARAQLGAGNISKAIETGVDFKDGNKTPSMKWYNAVKQEFNKIK